jgi:sugar O-acyltransferase (sialic acid O-acetyltransferase NeuD family)
LNKPILVIGGGGHAAVLVEILRQTNQDIIGIVAPVIDSRRKILEGIRHFKDDTDILQFPSESVFLVNGIGSLPGNPTRETIYNKFVEMGYQFANVTAPSSIVSKYADLDQGVQILPGAIVQCGAKIGRNTIVNSGAIVEHDCVIGGHNHLAPGAMLSGEIWTGDSVHIGTGAVVIQSIAIGHGATVGAGANITKDVANGATAFGFRFAIKDGK